MRASLLLLVTAICLLLALPPSEAAPARTAAPRAVFGSNVHLFNSRMSVAEIQKVVDAVAARQVDNQFGSERDALLFEPGVYGSREQPLTIKVGYYTSVAGLGAKPTDVRIHGLIQVRNRCFKPDACVALDNFYRSVSNLTLDVVSPQSGCEAGNIYAISQAAPVRRLKLEGGTLRLTDPCTSPAFASGGYVADSQIDGEVLNGGQQQFLVRNSRLGRWQGGNWNQLFVGVEGSVPSCGGNDAACPYFSLPTSPVSREAPYLYRDAAHKFAVFRPDVRYNTQGASWSAGKEAGNSTPLEGFFIATPEVGAARMNEALKSGKNLLLTPGLYHLTETLSVEHAGQIVLGLGFPTLVPEHGSIAMQVLASRGVAISGLVFEAGAEESPELLRVGNDINVGSAKDPTSLHDVFFRVGGAGVGKAKLSLVVNSSHAILDHIWAWRADHGQGVGWRENTADTGLIVRGDQVIAYGLFVEHYQRHEVIWSGNDGTVIFLQNEMPYDPPEQAAWRQAAGEDGFAAFRLTEGVTRFKGYGFGSYSYFNQGVPIFAAHAFEVPRTLPKGSLKDVFTIFLNVKASGGIRHVVNEAGGSATAANPDVAVRVQAYP